MRATESKGRVVPQWLRRAVTAWAPLLSDHPHEYAASPGSDGIAHAELRGGVPDWLLDQLARLSERRELTIVFPHWGPNMSASPAPWQRRAAAAIQHAGASLVAGHMAHVFHGIEWSERGAVLFDLGDALDDYRVDPVLRNDLGVLAIWRPGAKGEELELVGLKSSSAIRAWRVNRTQTGLQRGCIVPARSLALGPSAWPRIDSVSGPGEYRSMVVVPLWYRVHPRLKSSRHDFPGKSPYSVAGCPRSRGYWAVKLSHSSSSGRWFLICVLFLL